MPRLFPSYSQEILTLQSYITRQQDVQNTVSTVTPQQALTISDYGRYFPTLPPGLVRSLAQASIPPDHPVAQFAITQQQYKNMMDRGSWTGDTTRRRVTPHPGPYTHEELVQNRKDKATRELQEEVIPEAQRLGLIKDGVLYEPEDRKSPDYFRKNLSTESGAGRGYTEESEKSKLFNRLDELFQTVGVDYSYMSNTGSPTKRLTSRTPEEQAARGEIETLGEQPSTGGGGSSLAGALGASTARDLLGELHVPVPEQSRPSIPTENLRAAGIPLDPNDPLSPLSFLARPAFMAMDAPVQELQGQIRNIHAATHGRSPDWWETQSDVGVLLTGDFSPTDAGNGYFVDPESAIARERRRVEAQRGQIGDHNITLGRWVADSITTPDTQPFRIMSGLVDAGVQIADPTAFGLGKAGEIGRARRLFEAEEAAGAFRGFRQIFHGPTAERFLDNNIKLVETLAATSEPYDVAKLTNFKLAPDLTSSLAHASEPTDIRGILTSAVERGRIRATTDLTGTYTTRIKSTWKDTINALNPDYSPRALRILQPLPQSTFNLNDPSQVANNIRALLHNAHAPESDIRAAYNSIANTTTRTGLFSAIMDAQGDVGNMLRHYGIKDDSIIQDLINVNRESYNEHLSGLYDEIGRDMPTWEHITSDGTPIEVAGPHLPSEYLANTVHVPNIREVRRLTSKYSFLTAKRTEEAFGKARLPLAFVDSLTSKALKPLWLMRLAWPVRVIGEEQIRMATAGLDSAFSGHPISWLSFVIGSKESRLNRLLETLPGLKSQSTLTLSGLMFDELDSFQAGVYNTHRAWLDRSGAIPLPHKTLYNRTIPGELSDFRHSWADELSTLHHDPVSNYIANHTMDDAVSWLWRGKGKQWRLELQEAHGPSNLSSRELTQKYVQEVSDRITRMTNGDTDLLDIIKTGTFKHQNTPTSITKGATNELNPDFTKHLASHIDNAPTKIRGNMWTRRNLRSEFGSQWDHALDRAYGFLMGAPTAKLSRAPAFKQHYWSRTAELLPFADPEVQQQVLANAIKSTLPKRTLRRLGRAAATRSGKLSLIEMEDLAKGYALDDTKALLYDISEKGQASDILRNVVPFAEAWKEMVGRWGQLTIRSGGKTLRRFQQTIQGARGEDLGETLGAPKDSGFFYKNEFGEEVFAYPGSQWVMQHETNIPFSPFNLPGVPVPLTGRVQGLNMFGSIFPSLGPVAQIPVAFFLQDKPQFDWWKKTLLPFGGPGADEADSILNLKSYMPTYMATAFDTLFQGGQDDRIYNSSVMYMASYLYSTGKYSNSIEDQQRLMEDARHKAQDVYAIRALGQFILPASPSPSWLIKDKDGHLLSQRILSQEFYDILDHSPGYQEATETFLERYGPEAIGAIIPHSSAIIPNVPTSLEAAKWVAEHPDIKKHYPLVYGLFAPSGDLDMETYTKNFYTNERDALTPDQWAALRDNTLANYWYEYQKRRLGPNADSPTDEQARWLRSKRNEIQEAFPHWGDSTGRAEKPEIDVLVRELYRIVDEPDIKSTDAGQALAEYLTYRDKAVEQSVSWSDTDNPNSFRSAEALSGTRQWLRGKAADLIDRYPEFKTIWDYVFDRELQVED